MDDNESEEPDEKHTLLYVSWDVKYETTLVWLLARRLVEDTGDLLGKTTSFS